jgi:ribose transport system permease protein
MLVFLRRYGTLIGFAAIVVIFTIALPNTFPTARNLLNVTQQTSMLMVVAAGMTIVMVMGDFDLSVGSMASLAGIVAALLMASGQPLWLALLAALGIGLAGGVFNGVMVSVIGILPFIATLATLTIFSGLAFILSGGRTISGSSLPSAFGEFARGGLALGEIGGVAVTVPNLTLIAIGVVILVWVLLEQTVFGRRLYAIGGNMEAAHLAGVAVKRLRLAAFALTGFFAAAGGLMYAARVASANPTQGSGLMLNAIAAVFLGMSMSEQGEARILATVAGVLVLGVLDNGLTQMNVDSYLRQVLVGLLILMAVAVSSATRTRR